MFLKKLLATKLHCAPSLTSSTHFLLSEAIGFCTASNYRYKDSTLIYTCYEYYKGLVEVQNLRNIGNHKNIWPSYI